MIVITKNNNSLCEEAKPYYYDCLSEESCGLIPQPISSHIEQCPHCQTEINRLKAVLSQKEYINSKQGQDSSAVTTMLQLHFAYIGEHVTCETVRPFLPGMLDPAIDIRIPTPITAHLDNCSRCAEDLKTIKKLNFSSTQLFGLSQFFAKGPSRSNKEFSEMAASVSALAERADSEVVTIYHVDESAKASQAGDADDLYAGFPIRVEVIKQKVDDELPAPTINFAAALKEKFSARNLKSFLKIGLPAAAVIVVGFALLLNTPSAKAVTLEQIYKAIDTVKNVYISKFAAGSSEPSQEIWISQTQNIYMTTTASAKVSVLWDMKNNQRKVLPFDTGVIETNQLLDDDLLNFKQTISGSFAFMPFNDISKIPPDSKLHPVNDEIPEAAEGIDIYELTLPKRKRVIGAAEFTIWRVFLDAKTSLPQKVEWYSKFDDAEPVLKTAMVIEYLDDSQIQKAIKEAGF
ncbi:MAG: hypothetical protein RQ760_11375 [Sedimentisphaerales bacterium]|nr:hypothetical protein [Sedimentisphaerales bacterium]